MSQSLSDSITCSTSSRKEMQHLCHFQHKVGFVTDNIAQIVCKSLNGDISSSNLRLREDRLTMHYISLCCKISVMHSKRPTIVPSWWVLHYAQNQHRFHTPYLFLSFFAKLLYFFFIRIYLRAQMSHLVDSADICLATSTLEIVSWFSNVWNNCCILPSRFSILFLGETPPPVKRKVNKEDSYSYYPNPLSLQGKRFANK